MEKRIRVIIIYMCLLILGGCGNPQNDQVRNEELTEESIVETSSVETCEEEPTVSAARMTREYIIEQNLFTEEELEGVDVEAILEEFKWKEGDENRLTWRTMFLIEIENQQIEAGILETIDYSYLNNLDWRENGLSKDELEDVTTIAFQYNDGAYFQTIILDKAKGKMYPGELCDLLAADIVPPEAMDMGEETWDDVMDLLDSCEVVKWKRRYQGTSVGTTGHYWWVLIIELENDEGCFYSGEGVTGISRPKQYDELEQGLKDLFK